MKRIYNLLLIFALVLVGGLIGTNKVNAENNFEVNYRLFGNNILFEWEQVAEANDYEIWYELEDGEECDSTVKDGLCLFDDTSQTKYVGQFDQNRTYNFHIVAIDEDAVGQPTFGQGEVTVTTGNELELVAEARGTSVYLEWDEIENVKGYTIYRTSSESEGIDSPIEVDFTTDEWYVVSNLEEYETYNFSIEAELKDGTKIPFGNVQAETGDSFALRAGQSEDSIYLNWDSINGAKSYDVYRYPINGIDKTEEDILLGNVEEDDGGYFYLENAEPNKEYTFYVVARDENNDIIKYSDDVAINISNFIKNFKINVNENKANLTWNKLSGTHQYKVYYYEDNEADEDYNFILAGTTNNGSYTINNLNPNKDYVFYVSTKIDNEEVTTFLSFKTTGSFQLTDKNTIVSGITNRTYNGKAQTQNIQVKYNNVTLNNKYYKVNYKNNVNAGTAIITIVGVNGYQNAVTKTFTISKIKNPIKVTAKNKKVKYKKLKKKKQVITSLNVTKAQGKVTYAKVSGNKRFKINKTTGKITVKKKTKKGTYYLKFKVTAAGNKNYKAASKTLTMKVVIK